METSFFTLGTIMLLGAMSPGPDFAMVTKNSLLYSRKAGIYTTLGIVAAICIHMTYCILGLAVIIQQSTLLFYTIRYLGAVYLIYLGIMLLRSHSIRAINIEQRASTKNTITNFNAFKQGFFCNLLNPKATLFFLTLFGTLIAHQSVIKNLAYALEILIIALMWFSFLSFALSHPLIVNFLNRSIKNIERALGLLLIGLAIFIVFLR